MNTPFINASAKAFLWEDESAHLIPQSCKAFFISFIEETYEGTTVYTLIVPDDTYEYFCNEFSIEENDENDEHWPICPEELYDILIHNIPDFIRGSKIYITSVSTWLDKRDNFLSENDADYIKFRDTFREIKNKLSDNGNI